MLHYNRITQEQIKRIRLALDQQSITYNLESLSEVNELTVYNRTDLYKSYKTLESMGFSPSIHTVNKKLEIIF